MHARRLLGLGVLLALVWSPQAHACEMLPDMPPRVAPFREAPLSAERYAELATQWREYVDRHPQTAIGYVYLWRASKKGSHEDGLRLLQKAYAIDPNCPQVLSELSYVEFGSTNQSGRERRTRSSQRDAI